MKARDQIVATKYQKPSDRFEPVIAAADKDFAAAVIDGRIAVVFWMGMASSDSVEAMDKIVTTVTSRNPEKCGLLQVIGKEAPPPPREIRNKATAVGKKAGTRLSAVAFVLEGTGIRIALTRSIVTGASTLKFTPQPMSVFPNQILAALNYLRARGRLDYRDSDMARIERNVESIRKAVVTEKLGLRSCNSAPAII